MRINRGFAYAYGWNVYYEKILGMWTIADEDLIAKRRTWVYGFLMAVTVWLPQMASLPIVWGDLSAMADCLVTNTSFSITILKIIILQYRRNVVRSIFVTINEDWERVTTKQQLNVMLNNGQISRFISILSFTVTTVMIAEFMALQFWTIVTSDKNLDIDPRLSGNCLFVVYYPFNTTRRFVFLSVFVCQFFSTIFGGMCCAAPDCMASMLVLHVCGQLGIIRDSLKNLVNETTRLGHEKYWEKLAVIVERHEQVNELAIVIKNTFSLILLVQMLACSVTFCLQSFIIFTTFVDRNSVPIPILELVFSVIYAAYTLTHLFIYCYVGDKLFVESTSLADNFYEAEWYNLPPKKAKAFLHLCHRSKIPLEMTAGSFCTFNLQLFNAVLKNSMGYFSMLVAMKERLVD